MTLIKNKNIQLVYFISINQEKKYNVYEKQLKIGYIMEKDVGKNKK